MPKRPRVFGLTGGIACGKSTVARALVESGVLVIDADQVARDIVAPGTPALDEIVAQFGSEVLKPAGELNRPALGAIIFSDPAARERLDAITHPRIRARVAEMVGELGANGAELVVVDAALMIETGWAKQFEGVAVVWCPRDSQMSRLMERDGLDATEAGARIDAQMPIDEKRRLGDHVVDNSGNQDTLAGQVALLIQWMRQPAQGAATSVGRKVGIAAVVVSVGVLISRMLGFVREMILAHYLGASGVSNTYFAAFTIPDYLNYLMAGGYMSITFIPIFARHLASSDDGGAWQAFVAIARPVGLLVAGLIIVAEVFAEPLINFAIPGFDAEQVARTAHLTRIVLPAQLFFIIGTLLTAVQYTRERFAIPVLAPIIYNLGIITGGLVYGSLTGKYVEGFAWGALGGAFVGSFALQFWGAWRVGLRLPTGVRLRHPALKEYLLLALPLMLGQSIVALDEGFARIFGSMAGEGAVSWLNYARRLMLVPVGLIGQAASVAAYPFLARLFAEGRTQEMGQTVMATLRHLIALSLFATAAFWVLATPTVSLLFERGAFTSADTSATAAVLQIYALGIVAWTGAQILARAFYARRQMWTPVLLGTGTTIISLPLYIGLVTHYGHTGLATASSISMSLYLVVLASAWFRSVGTPKDLVPLLGKGVASAGISLAAGAALRVGLSAANVTATWVQVPLIGTVMLLVWVASGRAVGLEEVEQISQRVVKRLRR